MRHVFLLVQGTGTQSAPPLATCARVPLGWVPPQLPLALPLSGWTVNALRAHLTLGGLISLEGNVVSELAGEQVPLPCAVVCPQRRRTLASGLASEAGCVAAVSSLLSWGPLWYFMCYLSIKTLSGLQGRAWLVGFLFKFECESALAIRRGRTWMPHAVVVCLASCSCIPPACHCGATSCFS